MTRKIFKAWKKINVNGERIVIHKSILCEQECSF